MKARIKICGITNLEDALAAVDFGTDAIGFVFFKNSPRFIPVDTAAAIIRKLPPFITTVGVFVNESPKTIKKVMGSARIDMVQLHGEEPPGMCSIASRVIKAIRVKSLSSLDPLLDYKNRVSAFLLDTFTENVFGGTGQIFNWDIAVEAKQFGRIILAGGLNPDNIADAVKRVRPYGVDVSSGVESGKGRKDHKKIQLFIERAKAA
jgi:phosphoribosylanthranilate isomerase